MPLLIGFTWAAIFAYLFHHSRGRRRRWLYLAVGAAGLIVGAAFTAGASV